MLTAVIPPALLNSSFSFISTPIPPKFVTIPIAPCFADKVLTKSSTCCGFFASTLIISEIPCCLRYSSSSSPSFTLSTFINKVFPSLTLSNINPLAALLDICLSLYKFLITCCGPDSFPVDILSTFFFHTL